MNRPKIAVSVPIEMILQPCPGLDGGLVVPRCREGRKPSLGLLTTENPGADLAPFLVTGSQKQTTNKQLQ